MEQLNLISTALKINLITNLNTYVLDSRGNFIFHHEVISIPSFMPGAEDEDILYFYNQINLATNELYSYTNEWGLHYFGYCFPRDESYAVIIGPFLELTPNLFSITREYNLNHNESENLRSICNRIQVVPTDKANSFSSILQSFEVLLEKDNTPNRIVANKRNHNYKRGNKRYNTDEDAQIVKMRYKIEGDFIHAVEQGNKSKAMELINSNEMLLSFSERFPNQPLRRVKNLAIVLSTLLRSAAIRSNVPAILVHRVSEKYAYEIENTSLLSKLQQLNDDMIIEYTDLVISNSLSSYSKVTQKAIEFLMSYYDKQIDKSELAALCYTHPSHLSRKFKQETNMTITDYQQMIRINKAKHLLKNEAISIEEIAWLVGYEDSSYFSRVFKRETGCTPSQFRNSKI
ncbi:hypothetical protein CIL05_05835 [Virgibacillus profundi]|uniref:HTH araC/xylS-type domain-containing protein n=1 Tax=Virgibacillus profundi TaxID=2024555 RepID=A0A2A2IF35_9BACI|nr:AraC family transcriptional regulator [Virgibacillus profundi]PAV30621.1 hypothetical protein CIL05_05835 [Virgibacillus profundi]PXY54793.1 AraC family transcriptional regulator [Virgibacillus profundi]